MAIVITARGTGTTKTANSVSLTLSATLTAGNSIIVSVASDSTLPANSVTLVDSGHGPLVGGQLAKDVEASNSGHVFTSIWSLHGIPSAVASVAVFVQIANGSSDSKAAVASEISGLAAIAFDKSSTGIGSSATPSSGATATLTQASEICIGAVGTEGPGGVGDDLAGSWSNSFLDGQRVGTTAGGATGNQTISEGYLIVNATTAQTAAKTGITSRNWAAAIATYKEAAVTFLAKPPYLVSQSIKRSNSW